MSAEPDSQDAVPPARPPSGAALYLPRTQWLGLLRADMQQRWRSGQRVMVEYYLERYPALGHDSEGLLDLIYQECLLREEQGEHLDAAEYLRRFPEHADSLRRQLDLHMALGADSLPVGSAPEHTFSAPDGAVLTRPGGAAIPGSPAHEGTLSLSSARQIEGSGPVISVPGYEIVRELGRGGMGVVYQARDVTLGRVVALKMILAGEYAAETEVARFRTEAESLAQQQHPNIVQIHKVGQHNGLPFFSLEYCGGGSLAQILDGTPLAPRQAAELVEKLARAMAYAHQRGIIHRDLKPANVLLTEDGTPKITDFGLAKKVNEPGPTASGAIMGTPSYMAPEQAGGKTKQIGPEVDVYALGTILYECLTGRPPFKAATPLDTMLQVICDDPAPPRQLNARVPRDLERICLTCLQKEPHRRYPTALALADDLHHFLAGEPVEARSVSGLERLQKWIRRRPSAAALLAVSAVATVLLLAGWVWFTAQLAGQRNVARQAALREALARRDTDAERDRTKQQLDRAERLLYFSKVRLALQYYQDNQVGAAWTRLEECLPDLRGWEHRYLQHLCQGSEFTLTGHTAAVTGLSFSPDGRQIASASLDETVRTWNALTGQPTLLLEGHDRPVSQVCFSPDGHRLASASADNTVKVWDLATGREVLSLERHTDSVLGVCFSPDGRRLASAGADNTVRVWDAATGAQILSLEGHSGGITSVAYSPDGRQLASGCGDGTVTLWQEKGQQMRVFKGHSGGVSGIGFSPDGKHLASSSGDGTVKVWDLAQAHAALTLRGRSGGINGVSFSPDGRYVATSGSDRLVKVWDLATGQLTCALKGHTREVHGVSFSPDGRRLSSSSADETVKVWDLATTQRPLCASPSGPLLSLCFSSDSRCLAGCTDKTVMVWDAMTGQEQHSFKGHEDCVRSVAFSSDSRRVASAGDDRRIKVWDLTTGQEVLALADHEDRVLCVRFSSDGRLLASGSADNLVKLRDAATGREMTSLKGHTDPVQCLAFTHDSQRLASGSVGGEVKVWDVATGREILSFRKHEDAVTGVSFSPDGRRLATASDDGTVRLWDALEGEEIFCCKGHTDMVTGVSFSPDGSRLVSSSDDGTVRLWDVVTGQEALSLRGPAGGVTGVCFSPDGFRIAGSCSDGTVRLCETQPTETASAANRGKEAQSRIQRVWHEQQARSAEEAGQWLAAVFHLERLLRVMPLNARWLVRQGHACAASEQTGPAAAAFVRALLLDPHVELWPLEVAQRRGEDAARADDWPSAIPALAAVVRQQPNDVTAGARLAVSQVAAGQIEAYRQTCAGLMDRFGATTDPAIASTAAWSCVLRPGALSDPSRAVLLAERAVAVKKESGALTTLGAALVRAGRDAEAVPVLEEGLRLQTEGGSPEALLFLALGHHHLKQSEKAEKTLKRAITLLKQTKTSSWQQAIEWRLLRDEAASVLQR